MNNEKRRPFRTFASFILAVLAAGGHARAANSITFLTVGSDVVETGSGAFDLTGLTFFDTTSGLTGISPNDAVTVLGVTSQTTDSVYTGLRGPTNFGDGTLTRPNTGTGDRFGVAGVLDRLEVPAGYVSGSTVFATDTFANTNFETLGLRPGTYTYTWGTGPDQSLTVQIGPVPEPSSAILAMVGAAGVISYRWFLHRRHQRRQEHAPNNHS